MKTNKKKIGLIAVVLLAGSGLIFAHDPRGGNGNRPSMPDLTTAERETISGDIVWDNGKVSIDTGSEIYQFKFPGIDVLDVSVGDDIVVKGVMLEGRDEDEVILVESLTVNGNTYEVSLEDMPMNGRRRGK